MSDKMTFQVLRPVGLSGRKERGEIVELTLEDAQNIGGEYLKPVKVTPWGTVSDNPEVVLTNVDPVKPVDTEQAAKDAAAAEEKAKADAEAAAAQAKADEEAKAQAAKDAAAAAGNEGDGGDAGTSGQE